MNGHLFYRLICNVIYNIILGIFGSLRTLCFVHISKRVFSDFFNHEWKFSVILTWKNWGPIDWPARSPDLTPTDFFLWSVIKDHVYAKKPQNLQALKDAIVTEIQSLPVKSCRKACQSVPDRLQLCKDVEGEHIEQYLWLFFFSVVLMKILLEFRRVSFVAYIILIHFWIN
jgi:hypothetical protein